MKFLVAILLFSLTVLTNAQSLDERQPKAFAKVDSLNTIQYDSIVTLKNEEFLSQTADGGGQLLAYFSNGTLYRIYTKTYFSFGEEIIEYYIANNQLFFVAHTANSFVYVDSIGSYDYTKLEPLDNANSIFKNDKLIDLESIGHFIMENELFKPEEVYIQNFKRYKTLLLK